MTSIKNNDQSMIARANNSHRYVISTVQLQAVVAGGGNAVVEVLVVAMQVIPEPDRASPRPRRASPPRARQPRQQLLHRRSRPAAAAPGVDPPAPAAAAAVQAEQRRRHMIAHSVLTSQTLSSQLTSYSLCSESDRTGSRSICCVLQV